MSESTPTLFSSTMIMCAARFLDESACSVVSDDTQISRSMTILISLGKVSDASQTHYQLSCRHTGLRFDKAGDSVGNRDLHRCRLDLERERSTLSGYSASLPRKSASRVEHLHVVCHSLSQRRVAVIWSSRRIRLHIASASKVMLSWTSKWYGQWRDR